MIRAVVFDMDGTLLDTEPYYARAFAAAAADLGLIVPPGLHDALIGLASPDRAARLRAAFGADFPHAAFMAAYYHHRAETLPARIPLRPGALALLRRLTLPRAIATSASQRTAAAHLDRAGIAHHFDVVVTRNDVARNKPAPDGFLHAARRLGVCPAECLAVEDSEPGLRAACAAGMTVVLVSETPHPRCATVRTLAEFDRIGHPRLPSRATSERRIVMAGAS